MLSKKILMNATLEVLLKKLKTYLKKSGIGDKAYFGPEAEFFVFDDVKYKNDMNETGFKIDSSEGPYNTGRDYENGNMGHRPGIKGWLFSSTSC